LLFVIYWYYVALFHITYNIIYGIMQLQLLLLLLQLQQIRSFLLFVSSYRFLQKIQIAQSNYSKETLFWRFSLTLNMFQTTVHGFPGPPGVSKLPGDPGLQGLLGQVSLYLQESLGSHSSPGPQGFP
jgi:hypothetical protein